MGQGRKILLIASCAALFGAGDASAFLNNFGFWKPKVWGTQTLIESVSTNVTDYDVAANASGQAVLALCTGNDVILNNFDGSAWNGVPVTVQVAAQPTGHCHVAMSSNGTGMAIWRQLVSGNYYDIFWARWTGSVWETPDKLCVNCDRGSSPRVALDGAGNAFAIFRQNPGPSTAEARYLAAGSSTWTVKADGDTDIHSGLFLVTHQAAATSKWVASWIDSTGNSILRGKSTTAATAWSSTDLDSSSGTLLDMDADTYNTILSSAGNNKTMAVWAQPLSSYQSVYARFFDGTTWSAAASLESATGDVLFPNGAVHSSGTAMAVWPQYDGTRNSLRANYYNGSSWAGMVNVETNTNGSSTQPNIVFNPAGTKAVASWIQINGAYNSLWTAEFDGAAWATPISAEGGVNGHVSGHSVLFYDAAETLRVIWAQSDGTNVNLYMNKQQ